MKRSMSLADLPEPAIRVPAGATTLAGFREWILSDEFPEHWRVSYIQGELFIDMSPEELDTHNKVKTEVTLAVGKLIKELDLGDYYSDGVLVTNEAADLSTEPDGTFVSWRGYEAGRVRLIPRKNRPGQYIELQGTPDWVLEIVSQSSVQKTRDPSAKSITAPGSPNTGSSTPGPTSSNSRSSDIGGTAMSRCRHEGAGFDRASSAAASAWNGNATGWGGGTTRFT